MQTHDFFTRVIAANCVGPNMKPSGGDDKGCIVLYECPLCEEKHDDSWEAQRCCRPNEIFRCAVCREDYEEEDEATACCPGVRTGQPMQCPVCCKAAETFEIAADCCLHTHPTMTALGRERVAKAVEKGTPWNVAVAENVQH